MNHSTTSDTMYPDLPGDGDLTALIAGRGHRATAGAAALSLTQRAPTLRDSVRGPALAGLAAIPTIVAIGPFDNPADARQLAAAFVAVRQRCTAQLVLLGAGVQRATLIRRTSAHGVGSSVRVVRDWSDDRWSEVVAAADLVVLSSASGTATLLDVMAAGRPVVAPADPTTVQLVVPAIAGLVYAPGDVSGMTAALLRLLTAPVLRRGMGGRATNVARRHRLETIAWHECKEGNRV